MPIAKDILTDVYDIEYAFRVRLDGLAGSDWGNRLDQLMEAVAIDLAKKSTTFPAIFTTCSARRRSTATTRSPAADVYCLEGARRADRAARGC